MNDVNASGLKTVGTEPYVGETPQIALGSWLTPNPLFYVRSQFDYPDVDEKSWRLQATSRGGQRITFSLDDIRQLPKHTLPVTLECAGNNRADLNPKAPGNQFDNGAVSNAVWSGTSLNSVLSSMNLSEDVVEILFEGADIGSPTADKDPEPYLRSLPLDLARHQDTLLAYEMNGETLSLEHGYPVRLLVPGWYGMAHVKWLTKITALTKPFSGYFQGEKYVLKYEDGTEKPVQEMQVKSAITSPGENESLKCCTDYHMSGNAWSGRTGIAKVEVSVDCGNSWIEAELTGPSEQYSWQQWNYKWTPNTPGEHTLLSRATNSDGEQQPLKAVWNELGYAINGSKPIKIIVSP
jgi:DMSO/TMAO reductase YedYZ molybdopterin-dependent catalytic subunit